MTPGRYRQLAGRSFLWLAALLPCPALPQAVDHGDFSVRFPSPEIPAPWDASDFLKFSGTAVLVEGSALTPPGVAFNPVDEIDGISTGQDRISPPGPGFPVALEYPAGRRSAGLGGPVTNQGLLNGNGGDKLRLYVFPISDTF